MENFVLYEELAKGDNSIIYKGRRKGTITFVAIHCVDKCKRPEVTNTVRMTHDIEHENIVKFHEWYETSNHLWLVVELCTGGSLETLIAQDGSLPESTVRSFGVQLVTGLHYIHSSSLLFHDLRPSKILLDTAGVLKYADFSSSKVEGENLEELFYKFAESGEQWNTMSVEEMMKFNKWTGSLMYMAPELIQGSEPNFLSDLWSLGCVLYQMFAGYPPFLAESDEQVKERIIHKDFPVPKVKGPILSAKPSPEFLNLLQGLLKKDPAQRLDWPKLVTHSFWQGQLAPLVKDLTLGSSELRSSTVNNVLASNSFVHGSMSTLGCLKSQDIKKSFDRPAINLDIVDGSRPATVVGMSEYLRPKTAPGMESGGGLFTLSARPHTSVPPDDRVTSPHRPVQMPLKTRETIGNTTDGETSLVDNGSETKKLIFHDSDFVITQIVDNPKIQKVLPSKFDTKILPVPPFTVEKLTNMSDKEIQKQAKAILDNFTLAEKGPPSQKRIHLLHYIASVACCKMLSTALTQQGLLGAMAKQIKETSHADLKLKLARSVALVAHFTETVDTNIHLNENQIEAPHFTPCVVVMLILTELLRENMKNVKLKQGLLPALGEIITLVATQEQKLNETVENWTVPTLAYTTIIRGIREGDDQVVNHICVKVIETVTATMSSHSQKFVTQEVSQSLWYLFKHTAVDAIRCTTISSLCRLTWQSPGIFQNILDTGSVTALMQALNTGVSRIQQAVITMIGCYLASFSSSSRLFQDKEFCFKVMRCFESPSSIIRAKAFVVINEIVTNNCELLLSCCQARLVMYIERDSRRQTPRTPKNKPVEDQEYLSQCLELLVSGIVQRAPSILGDILECLDQVGSRKHPNAVQVKQLKTSLPLIPVFNHLVTSQVFRTLIINQQFINQFIQLLNHVVKIEQGEANIDSASAAISAPEFVSSTLSILEGISQHPALLLEHNAAIVKDVLPSLSALIACQNADTKAQSLQLFGDIASVYLSQDQFGAEVKVNTALLHNTIREKLFPLFEPILLDLDPLPSYALKLMLTFLEHDTSFIKLMEQQGLIVVLFQTLMDHQSNALSRVMQGVVAVLNCLVAHRETNMLELYDQGLVDHVTNLLFDVWNSLCEGEDGGRDIKTAVALLLTLLDTLHSILRYVSEVVRKALQVKNKGGEAAQKEAEFGEQLLLLNKSLTDLTSLLTQLLCYEDNEIQDLALKCLSLLVQLYGGENRDAMTADNMECYSKSLKSFDAKKQKIVLRVIKRLLSTNSHHVECMKKSGEVLAKTIQSLANTASSHADIALSTVAAEILKMSGHI